MSYTLYLISHGNKLEQNLKHNNMNTWTLPSRGGTWMQHWDSRKSFNWLATMTYKHITQNVKRFRGEQVFSFFLPLNNMHTDHGQ